MKQTKILFLAMIALSLLIIQFGCKSTAFTSAKLYLQQENYPKAIEFLEQEVAQNPTNAEAFYLLGYCYARDGRYQEMNEQFKKSLEISKQYKKEINTTRKKYWIDNFNSGVRKLQNSKFEDAIKDFQTAILIDPEESNTYKNLAYAYVKLEQHDKAVENYQKALEREPEDTKTLFALGMEYYNQQKYPESISTMEKLLKLDPNNKEAISYIALSYDLSGDREKALKAYENALKKNPEDPDLYFNRGRLFYMANEYEKAAKDFEKVVALNPEDFDAIYNVGNTYLSIGDKIMKKRRALEESKGEQAKIKQLADQEMRYYQKAKPYLEKATQLKPENANAWNNLMIVYVRLNMNDKAEEIFKKLKELEKK